MKQVCELAQKMGADLRQLRTEGVFYWLMFWRKRPLILGCLMLLAVLTMLLQERIVFVDVTGNTTVPTRMILEAAAEQGLVFGADRRALRSEEIKNELLGRMDSLEWVGVNTYGCRAVITVRERGQQPQQEEEGYCSLIAATDGIIEEIIMNRGNLLCKPGQAVSQGDVLVSGYKDLGICTRVISAQAEIYAQTMRTVCAAVPSEFLERCEQIREEVRFSLNIGKKRINLYSDSGILPPSCGKMTYSLPLRLPGGDELPVTLVIQRILWYNTKNVTRSESEARKILGDASERTVLDTTIAGQILNRQTELTCQADRFLLYGKYQCREMIARRTAGVFLEGDTQDDSQNSQRGAG